MHAVPASGPKRCIQCHQADSEIDIGVLHIQHPASSFNAEAPKWTLSQQQYCNACYRRAEQDQHQRELAKLWMALLPMGWMVFSGAFIYSCLCPNPGVAPLEAHLFFFGTSLAAFYAIPATIYRRFKRLDPTPRTFEAAQSPIEDQLLSREWASSVGNCAISTSNPSAPASSNMGSESAGT